MKYLIYIILLATITTSCDKIFKPQPNETALLNTEIGKINWEKVDQQAGLLACDSLQNQNEKDVCLKEILKQQIQQGLTGKTIKTIDLNVDSIVVAVTINPDSSITIIPDVSNISNFETQENIKQTIVTNTQNLPKAYPAIKRGIPVTTQINIPVNFIK